MSPSSLQFAWQNPFSSHQSRKDCYILSKIMGTHSYRPTWISPKDVYQGVLMAVCRTLLGSHSHGRDSLIWIKDLIIIVLFFSSQQIGPKWEHVVDKCSRGRYQPLLLLYTNPNASPINIDTAPKKKVMAPGFGTPSKGLYFWQTLIFFCDCGLHCGNKNQGSMRFIEHLGSLVSFYLCFMDKRLGRKLTLFKVPLLCPLYKLNNVVWMDLSFFFSFLKGLIGLCSLLINEQKIFNKIMCSKRCHL